MAINVPVEPQVEVSPLRAGQMSAIRPVGMDEIAQGTTNLARQVHQAQVETERKRNATRVFQMEEELDNRYRPVRENALSQRGTSAYGVGDRVSQWWDTEPAKLLNELENDTQRALFAQSIAKRRNISLNAIGDFERREVDAGFRASGEAAITTLVEVGAANFSSPAALAVVRQDIIERADALTTISGHSVDGPVGQGARLQALTKLNTQVIENMIAANDVETAKEYFEAVKEDGSLAGSTWDSITNKLETAGAMSEAQLLSDDIWARGLSEQEALAAVRSEAPLGQTRERALSLVRQQYAEQRAQVEEFRKAKIDEAEAAFNEGGLAALTPGMLADLQEYSPQTLRSMQTRQWTPQDQVPTDRETFDELRSLALEAPSEFAQLRLSDYADRLHTTEYAQLQKLQADAIKGVRSSVSTLETILNEVTWGKSDKKNGNQTLFERRVREDVVEEQRATGRPVPDERVREIMDRHMMQVTVPRDWWFDRRVPLYQTDADQRARMEIEVDEIPERDRTQIEAALRAHGHEVTDENVVRLFRTVNEF